MIPVTSFGRRTVAVFGLGRSGLSAARALLAGGAAVAAWDDSEGRRKEAAAAGIPLLDLAGADWGGFAALVLSPGVPLTHPEPHWVVKQARAAGVEVIGDVELFCRERARRSRHAPFVAVTGTNGKSTTTALIAHLLRADRRDVAVGGNLGPPILDLEPPAGSRFHVIELSSFQIDLTPSLRPTVGVLLNIAPDHLDRHGSIENYAAIKERVVRNAEQCCVSADDEYCRAIIERCRQRGFVHVFSTREDFEEGYHLAEGRIRCDDTKHRWAEELADISGIGSLRGLHNAQNALAAVCVLGALRNAFAKAARSRWSKPDIALSRRWFESEEDYARRFARRFTQRLMGRRPAPPNDAARRRAALQAALASFRSLPHRMEEIGRLGRVLFINDSKATNVDSAAKALSSFPGDIFWIAGGQPKQGGIGALAPSFPRIAKAYLIGEAATPFAAELDGKVAFELSGTLAVACAAAARDASRSDGPEPVVLLSPACASYDQFSNFEERGEAFRRLVSEIPGVEMNRPD
ncbi:MAG TPA: UDP-N-acetylmuramoyl-L-alanine--D-glutamate ligase [Hyphomicrobiaceae bacterium]|nr:UDP-N-acetylmuramoyl-L-alanine--D-glutamate ligase [Hyphomicrobiaceae bacterium]